MRHGRDETVDWYLRYNATCNRHAFDGLGPFLRDVVQVNGLDRTAEGYIDDLYVVVNAFPDYHWEVQRILVDEPWLAVHLVGTGTHLGPWRGVPPTGRAVSTDEFAMYRLEEGRVAEVWATADNARLPLP